MENIMVNNQLETVGNDRDIVDIIEKSCGYDFAKFIKNRLSMPQEITPELVEKVLRNSDFYSYESSLDDWNCIGNDVVEICDSMVEYIEDAKRIDKNKIYDKFVEIRDKIQENL